MLIEAIARSIIVSVIPSFYSIYIWLLWCCLGTYNCITFKVLHSHFLQGISTVTRSYSPFVKLTLVEQCHFHTAVQVFKVVHQLCPLYLKDWFMTAEVYTGHSGRNKYHLFIPQINTSIGKSGIFIVEQWFGTVYPLPCMVAIAQLSNFKSAFKQLYSY